MAAELALVRQLQDCLLEPAYHEHGLEQRPTQLRVKNLWHR
jgi:hypothetical protein